MLMSAFLCLITGLSEDAEAQTTNRAHGRGIEHFPYPFAQMYYVQPRYDRVNYGDGAYMNSYILRAFTTAWRRFHLRLEVPLADTNTSGSHVFGLSDINLRLIHAQRLHESLFLGYGAQLVMNTATDPSLGGGKWDIRPGTGLIYFRGSPQDVTGTIEFTVEYRTTMAKDAGRTRTNVLAWAPNIDWWFPKWYIGYYATWSYDFANDHFDLPLDVEAGYNLLPNLTLSGEFILPLTTNSPYRNEFAVKLRYSFQ